MDITTSSSPPATPIGGPYSIDIIGTAGAITHTETFSLTVTLPPVPPDAAISCDASAGCFPGGSCNGSWIAYRPTANPNPCIYTLINNSTDQDSTNCPTPCNDDIVRTEWYIKEAGEPDTAYALLLGCDGICHYTLQPSVLAGDYVIKLYVEDNEASDSTTHSITIRNDIIADFECSLDVPALGLWVSCTDHFNPVVGNPVYFQDTSTPSEGGEITSRVWQKDSDPPFSVNETNPSLVINGTTIGLTVADSIGRTDFKSYDLSASLNLPKWIEIPPY
jgi:hypothetical protein